MKNLIVAAVIAASLCGPAWSAGAGKPAGAKTETISGELLDMSCYMDHGGQGPKHSECALMCVAGGAPLGLLGKDGKVYLLVGNHADGKPFAEAKALAGSNAKVTGRVVSRAGITAIIVTKAEKL